MRFDDKDFYVDLVFYNYLLKCFVLIDLKIGPLTHQDIGQMDGYVRLYEAHDKVEGDNPTIGLILCSEKTAQWAAILCCMKARNYLPPSINLPYPAKKTCSARFCVSGR